MRKINEERLQTVYRYISSYQQEYGHSPSLREIGQHCSIPSTATVARMVNSLKERELIDCRQNGKKTYISVPDNLSPCGSLTAPIVGSCPCGEPMLAVENILSTVSLPVEIFGRGEHFLLYAKGDSMINRGIFDGDLMVVRDHINLTGVSPLRGVQPTAEYPAFHAFSSNSHVISSNPRAPQHAIK